MDRDHGKRSGDWEEEKEKEEEEEHLMFPIYSDRSQQDMSVMVSALAQVIGASPNTLSYNQHDMSHTTSQPNISQQSLQSIQGICFSYVCVHIDLYLCFSWISRVFALFLVLFIYNLFHIH